MLDFGSVFYLLLSFQGLFILPVFLFRKRPRTANFLFGIIVLKFTLISMSGFLEYTFPDSNPHLLIILDSFPMFLTGPLIYLYIVLSLNPRRLNKSNIILFIPSLISVPMFLLVDWFYPEIQNSFHEILYYLENLFTFSLGFKSILIIHHKKNEAAIQKKRMGWFSVILVLILLAPVMSLSDRLFLHLGGNRISDFFSMSMSLIEGLFIFIPAWFALFLPETWNERERSDPKYEKTRIEERVLESYYKTLNEVIDKERPYKQFNLTITELASLVDISASNLSQLINRKEGVNFFNYINKYRVEYACLLLKERQELNIIEIAYESGFNSKSTFNSVFKKVTGMTPGDFRKNMIK